MGNEGPRNVSRECRLPDGPHALRGGRSLLALRAALLLALAWPPSVAAEKFWDPRPPHGGQVAIGGGLIGATVSSSARSFDGAGGAGLQLIMDWRITEALAWDLRLGGFWTRVRAPTEIDYPDDDGDWSLLSTGLHYDLLRGEGHALWAGASATFHYGQMTHYFYSASGFGFGPTFGLDLRPAGPFLFRIGAQLSWVSLSSNYGDRVGRTFLAAGGLDVLYVFR